MIIVPCRVRLVGLLLVAIFAACTSEHAKNAAKSADALFTVPDSALPRPLTFIAYGDMRFTDSAEKVASVPGARRALVAAIAREAPAAVFLTGDVPWHGGAVTDYAVYRAETQLWRDARLRANGSWLLAPKKVRRNTTGKTTTAGVVVW